MTMVSDINKPQPDALSQVAAGMIEDQQSDNLVEAGAKIAEAQDSMFAELRETPQNVLIKSKLDQKIKPHTATVDKAKKAKEAQVKLMPPDKLEDAADSFSNSRQNPKFTKEKLLELTEKLKGLKSFTKKDILSLIQNEFPDFKDAGLALDFLASVSLEDFKELMIATKEDLKAAEGDHHIETQKQREAEVSKKVEADAAEAIKNSEGAIKVAQAGDLNELGEYLSDHPMDAPQLYKVLNDSYGDQLQKMTKALMKRFGGEIRKLGVDDKEDKAHMKNATTLLQNVRAVYFVERYFELRNPPEKVMSKAQSRNVETRANNPRSRGVGG